MTSSTRSGSSSFYSLAVDTDPPSEGDRSPNGAFAAQEPLNSPDNRSVSSGGRSSRYLPLTPIKAEIIGHMRKARRPLYSRGHEVPEPRPGHLLEGAFSRSASLGDTGSATSGITKATTTGSYKSSTVSPMRPVTGTRHMYSRPTTALCLNFGKTLPVNFLSQKFSHPLNNIYYEKSTQLASSIYNSFLPDGAESILEDSRYECIASFSRKEFYQSMPLADRLMIAELRAERGSSLPRPSVQHYGAQEPGFAIDYKSRGSPGARKRFICRQPMSKKNN